MIETIKVGPFDFEIQKIDTLYANELKLYGDFNATTQIIRIDFNIKGYKLLDVLIHEINHAIFWVYNIKDEYDNEERIVRTMATAWTQVYRDNPDLIKFITKECKS